MTGDWLKSLFSRFSVILFQLISKIKVYSHEMGLEIERKTDLINYHYKRCALKSLNLTSTELAN